MPTPRYGQSVRATQPTSPARDATQSSGTRITEETVTTLPGDSRYYIRGVATPTRASTQLQNGDRVQVQWKDGAPFMILTLLTHRGPHHDVIPFGGPLLEEIFIARRPEDDVPDVYFRNAFQCSAMHIDALGLDTTKISGIKWGPSNNRFLLHYFQLSPLVDRYYVIKIKRADNTGMVGKRHVETLVSIESVVDLTTDTTTIATLSNTGMTTGSVTPASPTVGSYALLRNPGDMQLDDAGHVVVTFDLFLNFVAPTPPGFTSAEDLGLPGGGTLGGGGLLVTLDYPIVYDATSKRILFSSFPSAPGDLLTPLPTGTINFNTFDFSNFPGAWQIGLVVPGEDNSGFVQYFIPSIATQQKYFMAPWACRKGTTGEALEPGRLQGYIGLYRQSCQSSRLTYRVGSPDFSGDPGPDTTGMPITSSMAIYSWSAAQPRGTLFPFGGADKQGVNFWSTLSHIVWQTPGENLEILGGTLAFNAENPCFITAMETGETVEEAAELTARLRAGEAVFLQTDFGWRPDFNVNNTDTPGTPPAGTNVNYFVKLWAWRKKPVVVTTLPEDSTLSKKMAAIPAHVVHPAFPAESNTLGNFEFQVVNSKTLLLKGRYFKF